MPDHPTPASFMHELTQLNPWWRTSQWQETDPQLREAARAPFLRLPSVLDDISPPNLYTLRGPRRVGKSTVLKQAIARLCAQGIDPRRICYFAGDSIATPRDINNLFQAARQFFPDLGNAPRYFFLDEITVVGEWQRGLKWVRDNTLWGEDCIVVSGSSAHDIATGATHLAGRRGTAVGLDRLLLPMSYPEFARCAGFDLPSPPQLPFGAFWTTEGIAACNGALPYLGQLVDAFEIYLRIGGFPQAVADYRQTGSVQDGIARDLWDVVESDLRVQGVTRSDDCLALLERVARSLASRLNITDTARDLNIARNTATAWLNALANSYLIFVLFKEKGGIPDVNSLRKVYPIDPLIAFLPSRRLHGAIEPHVSQLAESALAMAIFRAVEGSAVDRFGEPRRVFYFGKDKTEIDFVVLPDSRAAESKYVDRVTVQDTQAIVQNYGGGLILTRGAVDLKEGVTVVPASIFAWLLHQEG